MDIEQQVGQPLALHAEGDQGMVGIVDIALIRVHLIQALHTHTQAGVVHIRPRVVLNLNGLLQPLRLFIQHLR